VVAAQFVEEVGADAGEEVVAVKGGILGQSFHEIECDLGSVGHGDSYGAIELDYGGWSQDSKFGIEGYDAGPVGCFGCVGSSVAGCDFGLKEIGTTGGVDLMSAVDRV